MASHLRPQPPLSQDAAIVIGLAATGMPFAASAEAEAERWLRVLRQFGQVGEALQALGIADAPLDTAADPVGAAQRREGHQPGDPMSAITVLALRFAARRGARRVGTIDVLFAVLAHYGKAFDRALYVRGSSRGELLERLYAPVALADRR